MLTPQPSDDVNDPLNWRKRKKVAAFIPIVCFQTHELGCRGSRHSNCCHHGRIPRGIGYQTAFWNDGHNSLLLGVPLWYWGKQFRHKSESDYFVREWILVDSLVFQGSGNELGSIWDGMTACCGGVDLAVIECALPIATCGERAVLYIHESNSTRLLMSDIGYSYCANTLVQHGISAGASH